MAAGSLVELLKTAGGRVFENGAIATYLKNPLAPVAMRHYFERNHVSLP